MMLSMGRLKSETPEGWAKDPTQHPELFVKGGPNSSEGKEPFRTRCRFATEQCAATRPVFEDLGGGHFVACHNRLNG